MTTVFDPPPWAFELCLGCGHAVPLAAHELTCPCFNPRSRIAVAWICDDCDLVVGMLGLFTTRLDAITARQCELDHRAYPYFNDASGQIAFTKEA